MAQKNETLTLVASFVITLAILGGGLWWLLRGRQPQPITTEEPNNPEQPVETSEKPKPSTDESTFASVENVPSGLFNYGGSTTWAPLRESIDPIIQQTYPEFRLRYTNPVSGTPGSGSGIEMLLNSQLAFAQSSRPIQTEEYEAAQTRGFSLKQIPVSIDALAIAVHPNLNVPGITIEQLQQIYTGQITNWEQVGGPNLPITAYSRQPEDGGTVEFFISNVLGGVNLGSNVEYVYSTTPALRKVSENLGAIYYASAPEVVPQCSVKTLPLGTRSDRFIPPYQEPLVSPEACRNQGQRNELNFSAFQSGEYPITRRLFVIVKQDGGMDQQAGEAYANFMLTEQGQELIKSTGFVNLR